MCSVLDPLIVLVSSTDPNLKHEAERPFYEKLLVVCVKSWQCVWSGGSVCEELAVCVKSCQCRWRAGSLCEELAVCVETWWCVWIAGLMYEVVCVKSCSVCEELMVCEELAVRMKSRRCVWRAGSACEDLAVCVKSWQCVWRAVEEHLRLLLPSAPSSSGIIHEPN